MDYIARYASPLGSITLASDGEALVGLWFDGQKHFGRGLSAEYVEKDTPALEAARRWLDAYFSGSRPDFTPETRPRGTDFQRAVWATLPDIPYGQTATYGEIAERLRHTGFERASARAVGGAVGRNPISVIIPCHRVLAAGGGLTGYAGGIEKKRWLLEFEKGDRA